MKLNPGTHILIASEITLSAIILPILPGTVILLIFFIIALVVPSRTDFRLTREFLKILIVGVVFLILIHGIYWNPLSISYFGLLTGLNKFIHIASPVICVIYLSRRIRSEELFALLIDFNVPSTIILILFRTLWLVPRFNERIDEVVIAQKLRGMRVKTAAQRIRALIPTLNPIFSSMLNEISFNSLTLSSRGFLRPGEKTHFTRLKYGWIDVTAIIGSTFALGVLWF
ncbi:MAG: energy-coupling factor transporter transmembrane protein EcfT [Candidatus Latescibacteria bacterium]|nr:energy-coupling factor transporter transmembrane protein EcfT [Candidatus Latescibacterota bacterium]